MAEILYHKQGFLGPKLELHIAPEGLTLVGRGGKESVEYAPVAEISDVTIKPRGRKANVSIMFGGARPAWQLNGLAAPAAEWVEAVIGEEKSAADKQTTPAYSKKMLIDEVHAMCSNILSTSKEHAAVDLVDFLLAQGILHGASDVHFDPYSDSVAVKFRLDGVLSDVAQLDSGIKPKLTTRLKVVSRLATFKKSITQEGRAAVRMGSRTVDLRFSAIPTIHGEKVAVRIFDPAKGIFAIDQLGMGAEMVSTFRKMLMQPQGTILLTGPASSGKTTTMYAALTYLRENRKNLSSIATVEDPVEYDLQVVNQTQVNNTAGLTFATALRTVLRQDPEVIMIGEIRDRETADIAVQAGLTGHMILSTVHARSAAGVLLRMIDLGVEPFLLTSSVTAVLSQRLVRTICKSCAKDCVPTDEERERFGLKGSDRFYTGRGCEKCDHTGYSGRTGIFQLAPISDAVRDMVLRRCSLGELETQFGQEQIGTMLKDGLEKAGSGITTLEELTRVLG
ncbi:MAG: GspE/PulE family protein [Armatimonadetes bacterium]|nr:GspE/PulE family protein [Armatimonadota bacterium]